jgi:hypothetical protein
LSPFTTHFVKHDNLFIRFGGIVRELKHSAAGVAVEIKRIHYSCVSMIAGFESEGCDQEDTRKKQAADGHVIFLHNRLIVDRSMYSGKGNKNKIQLLLSAF